MGAEATAVGDALLMPRSHDRIGNLLSLRALVAAARAIDFFQPARERLLG